MGAFILLCIIAFFVYMGMNNKKNSKLSGQNSINNNKVPKRTNTTSSNNIGRPWDNVQNRTINALENHTNKDYLGKAANAKHKALAATKAKEFDKAWKLFHKQKQYYLQHANKMGFSVAQTLALEGSVHENMANVLRLESRHKDALIHIIYWIASDTKKIKRHDQKLSAYFERVKFENVDIDEAQNFINKSNGHIDIRVIQGKVQEWEYK
jgi:hypothetical protein